MDKKFVKLTPPKGKPHYYSPQSNDIGLENLGDFLRDVGNVSSLSDIIKYMQDTTMSPRGSNMTIIGQYDDYLEIRTASYDRSEVEDYETLPCLRIHRNEFTRVLREWRDFLELGGKEFLIIQEDDGTLITSATY